LAVWTTQQRCSVAQRLPLVLWFSFLPGDFFFQQLGNCLPFRCIPGFAEDLAISRNIPASQKIIQFHLLLVFSMLIHPRVSSEPFMLSSTDRAVRAGKEHWHGLKPRRIRFVPGLDTTSCFRAPDHHRSHS
jgi:hypothetical protein